jgi:quercetin dioxygenase-like cupin family protein
LRSGVVGVMPWSNTTGHRKEKAPMDVIRFNSAENYEPETDWKRVSLCSHEDISIEHFVKPGGHASPRHDHPNAQVLIVLKGKLKITTDEDEQVLDENDAVYLPPDEPHIVTNPLDKPSMGIDIFVPGRSFDFWLKRKSA